MLWSLSYLWLRGFNVVNCNNADAKFLLEYFGLVGTFMELILVCINALHICLKANGSMNVYLLEALQFMGLHLEPSGGEMKG